MPTIRPSSNRYKNRLMRDAANAQEMVRVRCNGCHRSVNYWAHDLIQVVGPEHEVHVPPFECSRCKTGEFLTVTCIFPSAKELQTLTVRRPIKQVVKWIWRTERA